MSTTRTRLTASSPMHTSIASTSTPLAIDFTSQPTVGSLW
jgi:hypothetical protein